MPNLNKVLLIGNFCDDPELRHTGSGIAVLNRSLATNEFRKSKDGDKDQTTEFHRLVFWDKLAENVAKYCPKGAPIYVEGKLQTREWGDEDQKRYTTEIVVRDCQFLSSRGDQNSTQNSRQANAQPQTSAPTTSSGDDWEEDDVPF